MKEVTREFTVRITELVQTAPDDDPRTKFFAEVVDDGEALGCGYGEFAVEAVSNAVANGVSDDTGREVSQRLPVFRFTVAVAAASQDEADRVIDERLSFDEDYGFSYELDWRFEGETHRTLADDEKNRRGE